MKRRFIYFLLILNVFSQTLWAGEAMVQSCHDGDTCTVQVAGLSIKVRLVGIDAPEVGRKRMGGQPFGEEAGDFLNKRVAGKKLNLTQYGIDAYNRPLVTIETPEKTLVNEELVRNGLAEVYEGKTKYDITNLEKLQGQAKSEKKGMWSLGSRYESPYHYRKVKRLENFRN